MNPQLDQDAVRLAKAIRQVESGNKENAQGASGEGGLYQWMPTTWASTTQKYGLNKDDFSRQNQNKAAYLQIKELKDQGKKPSQIAAFWNSGKTEGWENLRGVNQYGVAYDTPAYVQKVAAEYKRNKGISIPGVPPPIAPSVPRQLELPQEAGAEENGILETLIKDPFKTLLVKPAARVAEAVGRTGILGENIQRGYEQMADEGASQTFGGIEVEPQKAFGAGAGRQIGSDALKAASYLYTGGGAPKALATGMKGEILKGMGQGAKIGAVSGGLYGAGESLAEEGTTPTEIAKQAGISAAVGGTAGLVLGGVGGGLQPILNREKFVDNLIRKDVDEVLKNGRAMTNATGLIKQKNIPIEDILSDPEVFRGIKVQDNKIVPDDAVAVLEEKLDALMRAKRGTLPEIDKMVPPVSKKAIADRARSEIQGTMTLADESRLLKELDDQLSPYPEYLKPTQIDELRARARASSRNARGLQKDSNVYSALENSSRDTLFDITAKLPVEGGDTFASLHTEIKNLIGAKEFIDKVLRGRNAPGAGWAREALARIIGTGVGASHGPLAAFAGAHIGGAVQNIIANKRLGNSMKMTLIKNLTKDKKIIREAERLMKSAKAYDPLKERLALPAPSSIRLGPKKPPVSGIQVVPAAKGEPGRTPKGREGAGKFFKTFTSEPAKKNKSNLGVAPIIGSGAGVEQDEKGNTEVNPYKALAGMGVGALVSRGQISPEAFKNFTDLSTKLLAKLEGRTTVSKQFISDLTNSPDLKQTEKELFRKMLAEEGDTVDVKTFANKVKSELLPLERGSVEYSKYENVSLPEELRGSVRGYKEHVYESPIKTSAGDVHFSNTGIKKEKGVYLPKNYFAHSRIEDMADGKTRRVIEAQSDLFQKGRLEQEKMGYDSVDAYNKDYPDQNFGKADREKIANAMKLEPYRNTWHERVIREEVKQAAKDGKTKLQFPTGETAMKIEGLGENNTWKFGTSRENVRNLTVNDLKVGMSIGKDARATNPGALDDVWIITDVLGDGKFKAVPRDKISNGEAQGLARGETINDVGNSRYVEEFDISGKVDTNNPIYKFYEKEVGRYLKNKYGAELVTDAQGVKWWELNLSKEQGRLPVEAFGVAPLVVLPPKKEDR